MPSGLAIIRAGFEKLKYAVNEPSAEGWLPLDGISTQIKGNHGEYENEINPILSSKAEGLDVAVPGNSKSEVQKVV